MMSNDSADCLYGGCYLEPFSEAYDQVHIPLSATICMFGAVSNTVNIIVLTRRNMRTPINIFLTGLSVAQFLLDTNYIGLLLFECFRLLCYDFAWSYVATFYRLVNVNLNVVFHTVAFAHTLAVALFRFMALKWPLRANRFLFCNSWALACSLGLWLAVPLLCFPVYLTSTVAEVPAQAHVCALRAMFDLSYDRNTLLVSGVFWMFGIVLKLLPCTLLALLLASLIRSLETMEHRRQDHLQRKISVLKGASGVRPKTTHTLLAILVLCFVVEFPHGVLNLFTAVNGENFGVRVYDHLGSFMEMLTLLYSSISFVLYCVTSNDFLRTFRQMFMRSVDKLEVSSNQRRSLSTGAYPQTRLLEPRTLRGPCPVIVVSKSG